MNDNFLFIFSLFIIMFICGSLVFLLNFQYFLINLISIEFMMVSLFSFSYFYLLMFKYELIFSMIFLSFMVSEGVLGLSLLISMVRCIGNNYFQSLNLLKW